MAENELRDFEQDSLEELGLFMVMHRSLNLILTLIYLLGL